MPLHKVRYEISGNEKQYEVDVESDDELTVVHEDVLLATRRDSARHMPSNANGTATFGIRVVSITRVS